MIARIELTNFGCFRGDHSINLGPGAYAIVARHETRPRASNGIGKSMVLEAIDLALTGHQRPRRGDVDGLITRGENNNRVRVELEDGAWIERFKKRGQSRQVRAWTPAMERGREAAQDAAQTAFLKHLRLLSGDELRNAPYVEQKTASAFMEADPATRLSIVTGWLGLSVIERAMKRADVRLTELGPQIDRLVIYRDASKKATEQKSEVDAATLEQALKLAEDKLIDVAARKKKAKELLRARETVDRQDERIRVGKRVKAEAEKKGIGEPKKLEEAKEEAACVAARCIAAETDYQRKSLVASGKFDGRCPVANIACPAKDQINADKKSAADATAKATKESVEAEKARTAAEKAVAALEVPVLDARARQRQLEQLREEVKKHAEEAKRAEAILTAGGKIEDVDDLDAEEATAREEAGTFRYGLNQHRRIEQLAKEATRVLLEEEEKLEALRSKQRTAARARGVLRSAQRRIAERALVQIEHRSNEALAEAGVDLRLRARWEREGKDIAAHCDECGAAFPTSKKVKECERCGAQRGPSATQRLDLVAEDSSGGLDDLAGVAWQHAAGEWLLAARESPWSTAMLDEPTAALDPVSRRGLVRYLAATVRRGTLRQLLIVSHSSDTVASIPNQIVVVMEANGNRRIEVLDGSSL